MLAIYDGTLFGTDCMSPPHNEDDQFAALWRNELIKDLTGIKPALSGLIERVDNMRTDVLDGNRTTDALFVKLDLAKKGWEEDHRWTITQISRFRGGIAVLVLVGGLAWGYAMWQIKESSANTREMSDFKVRQEGINRDLSAKVEAALAVPTDVQELKDQMTKLDMSVRSLENAVHSKTPHIEVTPKIIIQKPDQSRSPVPLAPQNPATSPGFIPRLFHP